MYALVNTMNAIPGDSIGTVVSRHRTVDAAQRADALLQRMTRNANGSSSYLPTVVVQLLRRPAGRWLSRSDWQAIEA